MTNLKIIDLTTLHCQIMQPNGPVTSDKVYSIVVARDDAGGHRLITIYGTRTGTRPLSVSARAIFSHSLASSEAYRIREEKRRKGYKPINWQGDAFKKLALAIKDIDPNFGQPTTQQEYDTAPKAITMHVVHSEPVKPKNSQPAPRQDLGRSARKPRELDL